MSRWQYLKIDIQAGQVDLSTNPNLPPQLKLALFSGPGQSCNFFEQALPILGDLEWELVSFSPNTVEAIAIFKKLAPNIIIDFGTALKKGNRT